MTLHKRNDFGPVIALIESARRRAYQTVNATLVELYWEIGEYISRKLAVAEWGDGVINELAEHISNLLPGLRGFTRRNLFRMRQFYEAYPDRQIVSALLTQLPWTHHLIILTQSKRIEEREFYLRSAICEQWSKRELERQYKSGLFERTVLSPPKVSPLVTQIHPQAANVFRDSYLLEFLGLPEGHDEADLHRGLLGQLRDFLIELGRDFMFCRQ